MVSIIVNENALERIQQVHQCAKGLVDACDERRVSLGRRLDKQRDFDVAAQGRAGRALQERCNGLQATAVRIEAALKAESETRELMRRYDTNAQEVALNKTQASIQTQLDAAASERLQTTASVTSAVAEANLANVALEERRQIDQESNIEVYTGLRKNIAELREELRKEREVVAILHQKIEDLVVAERKRKEEAERSWLKSQAMAKAYIANELKVGCSSIMALMLFSRPAVLS